MTQFSSLSKACVNLVLQEHSTRENGESAIAVQQENQNDVQLPPFWSLRGLRFHWADPLFRKMLWNIFLLAWSSCLGQALVSIQIITTTAAATNFANRYLATVPLGIMYFVGTIWSIFLPRTITRFGYRPPFYFGALMGMIGAGLLLTATWYKIFWLLIVGAGFIGGQIPCTLYYRLTALQFSTPKFAQTTVAMVTTGGCLSAFMGPELAKYMVDALPKPYSGAYLVALGECIVLLLIMTIIQFPNVKKVPNAVVPTSLSTTADSNLSKTGRSIFTIAGQRTFVMAALGAFVSWSAMATPMSAAPLAMTDANHSFAQVSSAIEYHILGMFVPAFFTGSLCSWFGSRLVMLIGLLIELMGTLLFQLGLEVHHFNLGLIIVGIGWNFGYVGASVLLTKSYHPEEKTKTHSLFESIVMISLSISSLSAEFMQEILGWMDLNGKLISIYLAATVLIVTIDTAFVFYKTKDIRSEITVSNKQAEIPVSTILAK